MTALAIRVTASYFHDGRRLYELVSRHAVRNYGRAGGWITDTILRDCVTEETAAVDDLHLAALTEVRS